MKILNEYMALAYKMEAVEDKEEGGFVVSFPDLPRCITCSETIESAVANAMDAKKAWLEAALKEGLVIYEPDSIEDYLDNLNLEFPKACIAFWQSIPKRKASA